MKTKALETQTHRPQADITLFRYRHLLPLLAVCTVAYVALRLLSHTGVAEEKPVPVTSEAGTATVEGFAPGAYDVGYSGLLNPSLVLYGSQVQGDTAKGNYISPWYASTALVKLKVSGYPSAANMSLTAETSTGQVFRYHAETDPGDEWKIWEIDIPRGENFRIRATDASSDPGGWLAFSQPYTSDTLDMISGWTMLASIPAAYLAFLAFLLPGFLIFLFFVKKAGASELNSYALPGALVFSSAIAIALFLIFYYHYAAARMLSAGIVAVSAIILLWRIRDCRAILHSAPVQLPLLLMLAVGTMYLGILYAADINLPLLSQSSTLFSLPVDNQLQYILADRIITGQSVKPFIGDWLSSDRPPLLTAAFLMIHAFFPMNKTQLYQIAGTFLQTTWLISVFVFADFLRFNKRQQVFLLVSTVFGGVFYLNSVFLWPKLQTVPFFALLMVLYFDMHRERAVNRRTLFKAVLMGFSGALAMLSHGGIAFAIIALALTLLPFLRMRLRLIFTAVVSFALVYFPWIFYQQRIDPPGDRLLKYQLAGVTAVTPGSALSIIEGAYRKAGWNRILAHKVSNLSAYFPDFRSISWNPALLRSYEFFTLFYVLGASALLVLLLLRPSNLKNYVSPRNLFVLFTFLLSLLVTALLLFGPDGAVIHQSPYSDLILMFLIAATLSKYAPSWLYRLLLVVVLLRFVKWLFVLTDIRVYDIRIPLVFGAVVCAGVIGKTLCRLPDFLPAGKTGHQDTGREP